MSKELEEIKKIYFKINSGFIKEPAFNTKETRYKTIIDLLSLLEEKINHCIGIRVICDESNNTPEVIDNNQMIARVEWRLDKFDNPHYINLTFGDVEPLWV
jgi:hypothetical protein